MVREPLKTTVHGIWASSASPEDLVLQKLNWYREGGGVSDRQWRDVIGVIKTQGSRLDLVYLHLWAGRKGLADLLVRALSES